MLPPLDLMGLGAGPGSPFAATANQETPSGQFAANLLSLAQATASSAGQPRDLDHKTADAQQNLNGLNALPVTSELTIENTGSADNNQNLPLEDYRLLPVDPITDSNAVLPPVLPLIGNGLPVPPLAAVAELDRAIPPVDGLLEGTPRLDAISNTEPSAVVDHSAIGPDELGLNTPALDLARAVQGYGELIKPRVDALSSNANPPAISTGPALEHANLNAPENQLTNAIPTTATAPLEASLQAVLNPVAASTVEVANSLLTSSGIATNPFSGLLDTSSGPKLGGIPVQLRQAVANQNGQFANVGATSAETVPKLTSELTTLATAGNTTSSPLLPGTSSDLPGLSAQLPIPGALGLSDRTSPAIRSAGYLTASVARNDGLTAPAGNPIEAASTGVPTVTAATALRTALAGMDTHQLATFVSTEAGASATTTSTAVPADSVDAITPATPAATVARSTNGTSLLPSGLMPMAPSARLDVSDGMGGQWVGRLSQMIAQQQLTGQSLRIALTPAELGSVELTFSGSADNWAVSLNAQQGQTRELLESHLDRIRAMLQDLGVSDAQVAMADRWTGGAASSERDSSDPNQSGSEQNAGWQHSPKVPLTAAHNLKNPQAPSDGIDAYV